MFEMYVFVLEWYEYIIQNELDNLLGKKLTILLKKFFC